MHLKLIATTLLLTSSVMVSPVWAQGEELSSLRNSTGEKRQRDEAIQKVLAGQYSPEIYHPKLTDEAETRLRKQQINCLYAECAGLQDRVNTGQLPIEPLLDARRRLGNAKLEFHDDPEVQHKVLTEQLKNAKNLEASFAERMAAGLIHPAGAYRATSFRIDAELALLRLEKTINKKRLDNR